MSIKDWKESDNKLIKQHTTLLILQSHEDEDEEKIYMHVRAPWQAFARNSQWIRAFGSIAVAETS